MAADTTKAPLFSSLLHPFQYYFPSYFYSNFIFIITIIIFWGRCFSFILLFIFLFSFHFIISNACLFLQVDDSYVRIHPRFFFLTLSLSVLQRLIFSLIFTWYSYIYAISSSLTAPQLRYIVCFVSFLLKNESFCLCLWFLVEYIGFCDLMCLLMTC